MGKNLRLVVLIVLWIGIVTVQPSFGKDYPTKPVEILVPYTAGVAMDIGTRLFAETAAKYLGQPFVVVNKPGGGGSIAAADILGSKPDGYRLVNLTNNYFALTANTQKIPFDPGQLIPIANVMQFKLVMLVRSDAPWKTLEELVTYGKKNPGKLKWAHSGRGTTMHFNPLLVFKKAGVEAMDVPYQGGPESVTALLGGHVDATVLAYAGAREHIVAGKVRCLVLFSDRRSSEPANVPTGVELGFPETGKALNLAGLFVHKDTPAEIRETLLSVSRKACEDPDLKKAFDKIGEEVRFGGPDFVRDSIKKSEEVGIPILKELGLYQGKK